MCFSFGLLDCGFSIKLSCGYLDTVVDDFINIMKTTFEINFDFYKIKKSLSLIACKLVIRQKLANN